MKIEVIVAFIVVLVVFVMFIGNFMLAGIVVLAIDFVLINIVATYVYLEWSVDFVDSVFIVLLILDSVWKGVVFARNYLDCDGKNRGKKTI